MQTTQSLTADALFAALQAIDPTGDFRHVTYNLTSDNTIDPGAWWVNMPFGQWNAKESPTHGPLQDALRAALTAAPTGAGGGADELVIIDIAHLNASSGGFFTNPPAVAQALADYVNALPHEGVRPVIRYVMGLPGDGYRMEPTDDELMGALFPYDGDKRTRLITHPKAEIYCGSFTPGFAITPPSRAAQDEHAAGGPWAGLAARANPAERVEHHGADVVHVVVNLEKAVETFWGTMMKAATRTNAALGSILLAEEHRLLGALKDFAAFMVPSAAWNHAKIFAVRGTSLVAGGANYWGDYAGSTDSPYDLAMSIQGGAAADAHRFADYLWGYLAHRPPTDFSSWSKGSLPGDDPGTFKDAAPPQSGPAPAHAGTTSALTVAKSGMWPAHVFGIPVGLFDALRDFVINAVVAVAEGRLRAGGATGALLAHEMRDDNDAFWAPLRAWGISPAGWASRYARNHAIASARHSVRLSQQKFLMDDLVNDPAGAVFVERVVRPVSEAAGEDWNGWFWPFDTMVALGYALAGIHAGGGSADVVEIVCSYYKINCLEYQDPTKSGDFKARLADVMRGMQAAGLIATDLPVTSLVEQGVVYKRASLVARQRSNHSKMVMVDDALAYVGSDNAYPSYNQEFGVWLDDEKAVQALRQGFWDGLWSIAELAPPDA